MLSPILLLRKFNINVSVIKRHIKNSVKEGYLSLLKDISEDIDKKIEELIVFKKILENNIEIIKHIILPEKFHFEEETEAKNIFKSIKK
jgi:CRISPR/Cas system-associated protein Cas7 (RAMP superfamily)